MPSMEEKKSIFYNVYQISKSWLLYTNSFLKVIWKNWSLVILKIASKVIVKVIRVWKISTQQTVEPDEAIEEEIPDSPGIEKHDKEKDQKEPKKLRCKFFFPSFASGLSELIILLALQSFKVNL